MKGKEEKLNEAIKYITGLDNHAASGYAGVFEDIFKDHLKEIRDKVDKEKVFGLHADFYNEGIDMALEILDSYINEK